MSTFGVSDLLEGLASSEVEALKENTTLDFSGRSISLTTAQDAKELIDAIAKFTGGHMKTLILKGNTLGVEAANSLGKALEDKPELTRALWSDLFTGRMKTEIPEALSALGKGMMTSQAQLTVLDLSDNAFGPIGVGGLADLLKSPVCKFLKELYLNNNGIGITGTKLFVESLKPIPEHIEVWEMGRNRLENVGATALSGIIRNLTKLRVLKMPQNGIYISGVSALCSALQNCPKLEVLDLNDNTVGPKGAVELGKILHLFLNMQELNLGDCLLKSKGAISLLTAIEGKVPKLKELNLSFDEIGPKAIPHIKTILSSHSELCMKLGGNTLGSSGKNFLTQEYGQRAEVRAPDEEEDDYDDEIEEESEDEDENDETHDSGASSGEEQTFDNENSRVQQNNASNISNNDTSALDLSAVVSEICDETTPIGRFIINPSRSNLEAIGNEPVEIIAQHLNTMTDDIAYVECGTKCAMGLFGLSDLEKSRALSRCLVEWSNKQGGRRWLLANSLLSSLRLIKSESKVTPKWNIENSVGMLAQLCTEAWFPSDLLDTLKFFIKLYVEDSRKIKIVDFTKYPPLYQ